MKPQTQEPTAWDKGTYLEIKDRLEVGDEIGIGVGGYNPDIITTVVAIGKQRITVEQGRRQFNVNDGMEWGTSDLYLWRGGPKLIPAEKARARNKAKQEKIRRQRAVQTLTAITYTSVFRMDETTYPTERIERALAILKGENE